MEETIYKVTTLADQEGYNRKTLAYATGDPEAIEAFYKPQGRYGRVRVEEIDIEHISSDFLEEQQALEERKQELEEELAEVEEQLDNVS